LTSLEASSDVSLVELFRLLYGRRMQVLRVCGITAAVATIAVFLWPVSYTAEAVILTPQQAQSSL